MNEHYRVIFNSKGRLDVVPVDKKETAIKPCKVIGKSIVSGGKFQINFIDGRNILVDKDIYKIGDTIVLDLASKAIKKHITLFSGVYIQIVEGKYRGESGKVVEILHHNSAQPDHVVFKTKDGREISTLKSYAYVIGEQEPLITLGE